MPKPKRVVQARVQEATTAPASLPPTQFIARITKIEGKSLYACEQPDGKPILAELEVRLRSTVWIKRGGYVVIDTAGLGGRDNKLDGEIVSVVQDEKAWRKMSYWPKEFAKKSLYVEDSDDEESTVGKLPPMDSDEE